ncbi:hypothetical protein QTP70_001943 [Hemibagrus guttatus]|uniref:ribonuclease H n=1 Tax=Hemibagrus guttatus TaxID=175788 RepID=A0AAE0QW89_9TELE|nr:hypothetical protein QTP70_001943 [Hemibagrus guttatus]
MLQTISPDLLPFITTVTNGSLTSGHVPTAFKKARVIPILKKPALDPSDISNYRPVSLLSFLSEILERIVYNQLSDYLLQNNLHDPNQSGFKAAHSTETALLAVIEKLHAVRSAKLSSVLILLDLSAAFDTVNHKTLSSTLRNLGICGTAWEWFASYLDAHSYHVTWKGLASAPRRLSTGVPEGSVLGPLLFSLYTHSLGKVISSHGFSYHCYADDTQLIFSFPPSDTTSCARISACLVDISSWMMAHHLKLNPRKTELLVIPANAKAPSAEIMEAPTATILKTSETSEQSISPESRSYPGVSPTLCSARASIFISGALCRQLRLKLTTTQKAYQIHAVTRRTLQTVHHLAGPLRLQVGALHCEELHLLVLENATADIILGRPWLELHDPVLSWKTGEILKWGEHCIGACFPNLPAPVPPQVHHLPAQATLVESPPEACPPDIPACYSHFRHVFCPKRASKLPPHRPWDCAIDLIPGEPVPKGRIYSLSIPEEKAMEEYIQEALTQGYIRPSTSPAASSFFFVAKKDGGLRPCIDYRALNQITVKFRYPLPLVPTALEHLRGTIFTKLDLRSAYNLIRIREGDEWKTAFVTPTGHYEYLVMPYRLTNAPSVFQDFMHTMLREFLHKCALVYIDDILIYSRSLAEHRQHVREVLQRLRDYQLFLKSEKCAFHQSSVHFLATSSTAVASGWMRGRRFIHGYSSITSPLTSLLRNKPKSLTWNPAASQAFDTLKTAFTTAPLLVQPNPELPFVVEVDTLTTGVGAVLSQQQGKPPVLHPCAFFSRKLSPAKANYDIGNRELLAIKLALEEWRHWLEGAKHPFVILTDHKNLEYLRAAKKLNPRQDRWALFFTRFHFTISYHPGPKNVKADALSWLHGQEEPSEEPEPILPEKLFVSPISWSEETLPESDAHTSTPPGCPLGLRFIPRAQRSSFLHSTHTSLGTGHPGTQGTL